VKRTTALQLVLLAVLGGGITWLLETALAAGGRAIIIPPFTLAAALVLIAVIIVVMALPVRRVSRGIPNARIDPFYATRVVMLAKASSLSGALVGGGGLGIGAFLLSRSVLPAVGSVTMAFGTGIAGILLVIAGLVAEHWCFIPPDDADKNDGRLLPGDAR
jgi:hypothetical protein